MVDAPLTFVIDTSSIDLATQKLGSMLQATLNAETAAERAMNTVQRAFRQTANDVEPLVNQINRGFGLIQNTSNRFTGFSIGTPPVSPGGSFVPAAPPGGGGPPFNPPRGPDFNDAAESGAAMIRELDRMRARFDPLFRITQQYREELAAINRAHAVGALTTEQATVAADRLKVSTDQLVASMRRRGEIPELMSRGIEQRMNIQHPGAFIGDAEASADAFTASLNETRAALVPIVRITQEYEAGLERISKAYRYEEITADEATAAVKRHVEATNEAIAAGQRAGNIAPGRESFVGRAVDKDVAQQGEIDRARSQYDQLFRATQQYGAELRKINQLHTEEKITLDLATASITRKTAETNKLVASMQESGAIPRGREGFVGTDKERDDALRASLNRTRAAFDPLFAIGQRYKQYITEIKQANADGAISFDFMTAAIERERLRTGQLVEEERARQERARRGNRNTQDLDRQRWMGQNLMFQLQDVAVTAQMGMDPAAIALQQGSQFGANLLMMKDSMGGAAGMARSIGSAFALMLDPLLLIPIAVTFAGTALYQFFTDAGEGAKTLEEQLQANKKAVDDLKDALKLDLPTPEIGAMSAEAGRAGLRATLDAQEKQRQELIRSFNESPWYESILPTIRFEGDVNEEVPIKFGEFEEDIVKLRQGLKDGNADFNEFYRNVREKSEQGTGAVRGFFRTVAGWAGIDVNTTRQSGDELIKLTSDVERATNAVKELKDISDRYNGIRLSEAGTFDYKPTFMPPGQSADQFKIDEMGGLARQKRQHDLAMQQITARTKAEQMAAAETAAAMEKSGTGAEQRQRKLNALKEEQLRIEQSLIDAETSGRHAQESELSNAQMELDLVGKTVEEKIRYRTEMQLIIPLLQQAEDLNLTDPEDLARLERQVDAAEKFAAAMGKVNAEAQLAQAALQRGFEREDVISGLEHQLSTVGLTNGEIEKQNYLYQVQMQLLREKREFGKEASAAELAEYEKTAERIKQINEEIARATLQSDLALKASTARLRDEDAAIIEEERRRGLPEDLNSADAAMIRQMQQIDRLKDTWNELFDTVDSGMDSVVDALFEGTDPMEAMKKSLRDLARQMFDLAVTNPLKNFLTGGNFNTIADMGIFGSGAVSGRTGGFGGLLGNLLGAQKAVGTMQVQAGIVNLTGGIGGVGDAGDLLGSLLGGGAAKGSQEEADSIFAKLVGGGAKEAVAANDNQGVTEIVEQTFGGGTSGYQMGDISSAQIGARISTSHFAADVQAAGSGFKDNILASSEDMGSKFEGFMDDRFGDYDPIKSIISREDMPSKFTDEDWDEAYKVLNDSTSEAANDISDSASEVTESFDGVSEGSKTLTDSLSKGAEGIGEVVSSLADGVGSLLSKLITQGGGMIPKMFGGGMFSGLSDAFGGVLPLAGPADSAGGSLFSGMWHVMHTGGVAGESDSGVRRPFTADVSKLPRLHTGGLAGDEVPTILRKGEPVLPSVAALRGLMSGGGSNDNSAVLGQILQAIQAQKLSAKFVNVSDKREMLNEIGSDYGEQVFANTQRRSGTGRRL